MKLAHKVGISYLLIGLTLLTACGIGIWVGRSLSQALDYVTGPARDHADHLTQGSLSIQRQTIALYRLLLEPDDPDALQQLKEASDSAEQALNAVFANGFLSTDNAKQLDKLLTTYRHSRDSWLDQRFMGAVADGLFNDLSDQSLHLLGALNAQQQDSQAKVTAYTSTLPGIKTLSQSILWGSLLAGIAVILLSYWFVTSSVVRPVLLTTRELQKLNTDDADLTIALAPKSKDEIGQLALAFNGFVSRIHQLVSHMQTTMAEVISANSEVNEHSVQTQQRLHEQHASIADTAHAVVEMSQGIEQIANNTGQASAAADSVRNAARHAENLTRQTIVTMRELEGEIETGESVSQQLSREGDSIRSVLDVIRGIAEQTNLLALNAAIEAARAGESGRGFAVVADEVRTLASRTGDSTQEIEDIIQRLIKGMEDTRTAMERSRSWAQKGVNNVDDGAGGLGDILSNVESIHSMNVQIASATDQQNQVSQAISQRLSHIRQLSEQTQVMMEAARHKEQTVTQKLRALGSELNQFVT